MKDIPVEDSQGSFLDESHGSLSSQLHAPVLESCVYSDQSPTLEVCLSQICIMYVGSCYENNSFLLTELLLIDTECNSLCSIQ